MSPNFLNAKAAFLTLLLGIFFSLSYLTAQTYVTNGTAADQGGGCYRLTQALNGQGGSVWYQNKLDLDYNFQIEANLYFGTKDGNGADGIAFVLQPVCSGLGSVGGGLGYGGINPSLAVEYDTWYNGESFINDPATGSDHVGLQKNGSLNHQSSNNLAGPVSVANLENGANHLTVISYTAGTPHQTLTVTLDGNQLISYTGDIKGTIFGGNSKVFWGFTAATGAANNLQQVCITNVNFTELTPYLITDASCPNASDGAIDLLETGASYLWNTGATTQDISGLTAGNYSVAVTDANGCVSQYSMTVGFVPDTDDPVITCPADITVSNDAGDCGAIVTYDVPSYTDNCGLVPASLPGYVLIGDYNGSRYFRSTSSALSINARNASVAVGGHLATINSAGENNFLKANVFGQHWFGYSDRAVEGNFIWETGETPAYSNWYSGEPNDLGDEDFAEINFIIQGSWNDERNTSTRPWILEFDGLGVLEPNLGKGSGSYYPVGTTTMTYKATDLHGNSASCTFDITVNDTEDPTITCPDDLQVDTDPGACEATNVTLGSPTYSDNCPGASASNNSSGTYALGENTVVWTVNDAHGNSASCDQIVTVEDNENPNALCQDISVNADANGNYPIDANLVNNGSTDNCGIASISVSPGQIPCFHESTMQTVTLTVMDNSGNSHTCTATVTLLDDADCDGVGDYCDQCDGGNDQVDNNGDGLPDCAYFPGLDYLIEEWTCGQGDGKVLMCHIPPGEPWNAHTICVAPSAVAAHLDHGDYIGPCGNASCSQGPSAAGGPITYLEEDIHLHLYPNPAREQIVLDLHGANGKTATIRIMDNLGKVISNRQIGELSDIPFSIDLTSFAPGIYYLSVNVDGNILETQRFSVIR